MVRGCATFVSLFYVGFYDPHVMFAMVVMFVAAMNGAYITTPMVIGAVAVDLVAWTAVANAFSDEAIGLVGSSDSS